MKFAFKFENFEQYFLELLKGRRRSWTDRAFLVLLFIGSRFYRTAVQFRIWLYDKRVIRNHALGCLVVSIGNLSCGGTGKTPVVEVFAKTLSSKGRRVAILSRGYRSKKRTLWDKLKHMFDAQKIEVPPKIVSDGNNLLMDSAYAGDEPYMLASNLKDVAVLVDKDRVLELFVNTDRGVGPVDVTSGLEQVLQRDHVDLFVAGNLRQLFFIEVGINGDDSDERAGGVPSQDQGLIDGMLINPGVIHRHRADVSILVGREFSLLVGNLVFIEDLFDLGLF